MRQQNKKKAREKEEEKQQNDEPPEQIANFKIESKDFIKMQDEITFHPGQGDMVNSWNIKTQKLDIILFDQYKNSKSLFAQQEAFVNEKNEIILQYLIKDLKKQGFTFSGGIISYLDAVRDLYIHIGKEPLKENIGIPLECVVGDQLEIKIRKEKKSIVDSLVSEQAMEEETEQVDKQQSILKNRVKERKIGEVIKKVALWRRLYTGFFDEKRQYQSMPLDQAATKVGISKKTLDDYLLQIRCGKKYGFDFNKYCNEKIGKLRSFVKTSKNKEKAIGKNQDHNETIYEDDRM